MSERFPVPWPSRLQRIAATVVLAALVSLAPATAGEEATWEDALVAFLSSL